MPNLVKLPEIGKAVFVGDTHSDIQASRAVIKSYAKKGYFIIFLGDYVDRGNGDRANIDYLLDVAKQNSKIILLAGNHEYFPVSPVSPSEFWDLLTPEEVVSYFKEFQKFPLAVEGKGFIALHAGLPDLKKDDDWNKIKTGDENWTKILWADFRDKEGEVLGELAGRIKLGATYFARVMKNLCKNVLIRSHDPLAKERMFDNRCLTIFTSSSYGRERKIAILDLSREIRTIDDVEIINF
jgi:predicted phosphodiesterase